MGGDHFRTHVRLFSVGLAANLAYVASGVVKQYLIAAQLAVVDVGRYGSWTAQAALLLVLLPFPAYLSVLIRGFSASSDDDAVRSRLMADVRQERHVLALMTALVLVGTLAYSSVKHHLVATPVALALLLLAQYVGLTADITLRMHRAHGRLAVFMAVRNVPSLLLIATLGLQSPVLIAVAELLSAALTGWLARRGATFHSDQARRWRPTLDKEQATLWSARLFQYLNASLLRLLVPFLFAAHETGLFFFACIAQIPSSLFLSVTTQIFGHALARMQRGEYRAIAVIQGLFVLPNLVYVAGLAVLVPHWADLITMLPRLTQYAGVGSLVLAVALYSAVLASDCQEYLLRSRGLSRVLLLYNVSSILIQIACLALGYLKHMTIEATIMLCAAAAAAVLLLFSAYSFRLVIRA